MMLLMFCAEGLNELLNVFYWHTTLNIKTSKFNIWKILVNGFFKRQILKITTGCRFQTQPE